MKNGRQNAILDIISGQYIETQSQLMEALAARGIRSTQATLSRDIRELRLIKESDAGGRSHYALPAAPADRPINERLQKILKESVLSLDIAMNLIVLKTLPGLASAACSALDGMEIEGLVGTLGGDDTAFLAMKTQKAAEDLFETIEEMLL